MKECILVLDGENSPKVGVNFWQTCSGVAATFASPSCLAGSNRGASAVTTLIILIDLTQPASLTLEAYSYHHAAEPRL